MKEMTVTTAKYLAELFHEGQTRADKVTPYIEHPKMVAEFVEKFGGDDEAIALAWVHDILEESADKVAAHFHLEPQHLESKPRFWMQMKDRWGSGFCMKLSKLSDHWKIDQDLIKSNGKVAYLAELLISADSKVLLVKLCDMLANITESNGSRMSQETRYFKAVQCLKMAERKDLDERHEEVITAIEAYYNIHNSKK
ncbi:MAG: HD domain-containing protein [Paludibacteraceae bacterium]|nr:HD domain-containing protein [Paludibacteraceae bacterium]